MSKSDATIEPPPEKTAPKAPTLRGEALKWAMIAGLVGIVSGAVEGLLVAWRLSPGDASWKTAIAVDRTLIFGLLGAVLGALAGVVEWKLKVKRGQKG
jgi:hypothetical protein